MCSDAAVSGCYKYKLSEIAPFFHPPNYAFQYGLPEDGTKDLFILASFGSWLQKKVCSTRITFTKGLSSGSLLDVVQQQPGLSLDPSFPKASSIVTPSI